jgi:hypothetical protein
MRLVFGRRLAGEQALQQGRLLATSLALSSIAVAVPCGAPAQKKDMRTTENVTTLERAPRLHRLLIRIAVAKLQL